MSSPSIDTSRRVSARDIGRSLLKRGYRALVGPPSVDLARAWPGTATKGGAGLRHLHIGDCNFRRMDLGHDTQAAPGYPLAAAEALLEQGIGVEFAHYFCINFEHVPEMADVVCRARLSGAPDLITVHMGGNYTRWIVVPDTRRTMQMRVEIARRLGKATFPGYRLLAPFVRLLGRPAARYRGIEAYERFLGALRQTWPEAQIVVISPLPRCWGSRTMYRIGARVDADIRAATERLGLTLLDATSVLGRDRALRGASAYQLNGKGCEALGNELARQILELRSPSKSFSREDAKV